jgi:hypothetical protein
MPTIVEDSRQHAKDLLDTNECSCSRVISVDIDSVLYLDEFGRPFTAWLTVDAEDETVTIWSEPGFKIERGAK